MISKQQHYQEILRINEKYTSDIHFLDCSMEDAHFLFSYLENHNKVREKLFKHLGGYIYTQITVPNRMLQEYPTICSGAVVYCNPFLNTFTGIHSTRLDYSYLNVITQDPLISNKELLKRFQSIIANKIFT